MTLRPPTGGQPGGRKPAGANPDPLGANPLEYEMKQEMAGSLFRSGALLERALEALQAFDETHNTGDALTPEHAAQRAELLAEACERLWFFIVQRESCGLRRHTDVYDIYKVPADVRLGMGPKPSKPNE